MKTESGMNETEFRIDENGVCEDKGIICHGTDGSETTDGE